MGREETSQQGPGDQASNIGALLIFAIGAACMNQILYKMTLNAFSSPYTNYGFFVSQASTFSYTLQAVVMSIWVVFRDPPSLKESFKVKSSTYIAMAGLDGASSTLGTIAGAYCPGALQTLLNQSIIPTTMISSAIFLDSKFRPFQLWGSFLILVGAGCASAQFFGSDSATVSTVAILIFMVSVIPSALSNVYKDKQMKLDDMHEVHTSTIVSFWQLWVGFLFLPLMAIPALGGLSWSEMLSQLQDGWTCFYYATNPNDPHDTGCASSWWVFIMYVVVNFVYNFLLLVITKRGSAVLLVISQALSLPVTNICFTIPAIMGDEVEPMQMADLVGLVLVSIGFLMYSGFGFAEKFIVAQGPPGQMTYTQVEGQDALMISSEMASQPSSLTDMLLRITYSRRHKATSAATRLDSKQQKEKSTSIAPAGPAGSAGERDHLLQDPDQGSHAIKEAFDYGSSPEAGDSVNKSESDDVLACRDAIALTQKTMVLLQDRLYALLSQSPLPSPRLQAAERGEGGGGGVGGSGGAISPLGPGRSSGSASGSFKPLKRMDSVMQKGPRSGWESYLGGEAGGSRRSGLGRLSPSRVEKIPPPVTDSEFGKLGAPGGTFVSPLLSAPVLASKEHAQAQEQGT
jgi:drug/metabolite transporter (DMT)-like permease